MKKPRTKPSAEAPIVFETSSGNVFTDLGLKDSETLLVKAELVQRICEILDERKLTPEQTAKALGIDQSRVAALLRGRIDGFSSDRLFHYLNVLGRDVEIAVRPARDDAKAATRIVPA